MGFFKLHLRTTYLNNWRAIGYIFLGFGTVFLTLALLVFFGVLSIFSLTPLPDQFSISISLIASAPLLVLTTLLYIVGVVGYYAGRENTTIKSALDEAEEYESTKSSSVWSFAVGISAFLAALAVQYFAGIIGNSNIAIGLILPFTISIVAGFAAGIGVYLLTAYLD
jgi:hypothetical protein